MAILRNLLIISILDNLGTALTIIIMGPYMIKMGGSPIMVGVCTSISSLVSFLWLPVAGSISDSVGRKAILLLCIASGVLGNGLVAAAPTVSLVYAGQILKSVACPIMTLLKSIVDDTSKTKDEAVANFNKIQGVLRAIFFISLVAGGILSEYSPFLLFVIATSAYAVNLVLSSVLIPSSKPKTGAPTAITTATIIQEVNKATVNIRNLEWSKYWDLFAENIGMHAGLAIFFPNMGMLLVQTYGKGIHYVSYILAIMGIISMITGFFMEKIQKFYKEDTSGSKRIVHMATAQALAMLMIAYTTDFGVFLAASAPLFIGRSIQEATMNEILMKRTTDKDKGGVMGAFDSTMSFANIIAPLIGGVSTEYLGPHGAAAVAAIPFGAAVVIERYKKTKTD